MVKFISCVAADGKQTPMLLNTQHIIGVTPNTFEGTTHVMIPGAMIAVDEKYEDFIAKLIPN